MIGEVLTEIPGSSDVFAGGVICYNNRIKHTVLGVEQKLLQHHGAVSEPVVAALTTGVMRLCATNCAIAVSGIAGPDGGSAQKPVGLVYIGVGMGEGLWVQREQFPGDRQAVRKATVHSALNLLLNQLHSGSGR
jgi:PncC family amidohydrolase